MALPERGIVICHRPPAICGGTEVKLSQFPCMRLVLDCTMKPADDTGHERVKLLAEVEYATVGLFVLNNRLGPKLKVAATSAGDSATL